jgi:hypothetical protein
MQDLNQFISKWSGSGAAERANKDAFLIDLCVVLDVSPPDPSTGDPERDLYVFERDAILSHEGGRVTLGKIDLYKHGCFLLEAKQGSETGSKKLGSARRGTPAWNIAMRDALGQALQYARTLQEPPPFLITCDIGYCFDLYAAFDGSWNYRPFPDGQSSRIFLQDLERHWKTLRAIFAAPATLDPSQNAARVTREIAGHIAELARELEDAGHDPERVATFLMRCLFTLFAEDAGLLSGHIFTYTLENYWLGNPLSFPAGVQSLWGAMNEGSNFLIGKLMRFNGGLFSDQSALPLTRRQLARLLEAARCNWAEVEPAIFGTLLERALDRHERQRLGAHFTPRAYVERLVRPTIEEPLRADWDLVRAEVRRLVEEGEIEGARKAVRTFHRRLTKIRVLDPACGSGNFLYVSLDLFKRLESEVLGLLHDLGDPQAALEIEGATVTPEQFRGIEVKRWAKEIAELVLWIGYLQWQVRVRGSAQAVPEPVLLDYGNIEHRDAMLDWDRTELVRDEKGVPVTRWDGTTLKISSVTGKEIPDETATVPVYEYINPREAEWPEADFIVGNPPFVGNWMMRQVLGSGYTEALRKAHGDVPESVDFVMYWWNHAAQLLREGKVKRFGFITTKTITQKRNGKVVQEYLHGVPPVSLVFAIPNHPWAGRVELPGGAAVRIAMTVGQAGIHRGVLATGAREAKKDDGEVEVTLESATGQINADLTLGADVSSPAPLTANRGLSSPGVKLHGAGFIVSPTTAEDLGLGTVPGLEKHIRPYQKGRALAAKPRELLVIDLLGLTEAEVRNRFPQVYQRVLERVKVERDQNNRPAYRKQWWIFGEPRKELRPAIEGLSRFIVTVETAQHRYFTFVEGATLPDNKLVVIALEDACYLGILSSRIHIAWAFAAGGLLGGERPVYVKTQCFDPFPFPSCTEEQKSRIRALGEALDAHRKRQQSLHSGLTMTGMYNVLEKLRSGEPLNKKDQVVHEEGLVSILKQIHDELDAAVFDVYGWPHDLTDQQILERLVALNAERAEEERNGLIRWLRPELQNPSGGREETQVGLPGVEMTEEDKEVPAAVPAVIAWPKKLPERVAAVRSLLGSQTWDAEQMARMFKGARRDQVEGALDTLAALGLAMAFDTPEGRRWRGMERAGTSLVAAF